MLADFRAFCSDEDNRLLQYWEDCLRVYKQHHDRTDPIQVPSVDTHVTDSKQ